MQHHATGLELLLSKFQSNCFCLRRGSRRYFTKIELYKNCKSAVVDGRKEKDSFLLFTLPIAFLPSRPPFFFLPPSCPRHTKASAEERVATQLKILIWLSVYFFKVGSVERSGHYFPCGRRFL